MEEEFADEEGEPSALDLLGCRIATEPPSADQIENFDLCLVIQTMDKVTMYLVFTRYFAHSDLNLKASVGNEIDDFSDESKKFNSLLDQPALKLLQNILHIVGKRCTLLYHERVENKLFVFVRSALGVLKNRAEKDVSILFLLDRKRLQEAGYDITRQNPFIEPIFVPHSPSSTHINPYTNIYMRYKQELDAQRMYYYDEGCNHPFGKAARIKLLLRDLQLDWDNSPEADEDGESEDFKRADQKMLSLDSLVKDGTLLASYPILDEDSLESFAELWKSTILVSLNWSQAEKSTVLTTGIREFFGERIALYFWFLGNVMSAVLVLSVLGLLLQGLYLLDYFTSGNLYLESLLLSVLTPAFSLLGTVVLIVWAAKLSDHLLILATKLNLNNCLAKTLTASAEVEISEVRPEFRGYPVQSCVDGKDALRFSGRRRAAYSALSLCASTAMVLLSLICTAAIFYGRFVLDAYFPLLGGIRSQWAASLGLGVQTLVFNWLFNLVAADLTDFENHKYENVYYEALIAFAAVYSPVYGGDRPYGSAIMNPSLDCSFDGLYSDDDCSLPLTINVAVILTCQLVSVSTGHYYSYLSYQWKRWRSNKSSSKGCCSRPSTSISKDLRTCSWFWNIIAWFRRSNEDSSRLSRRYSVPNSRLSLGSSPRSGRPVSMSTRSAGYSSMKNDEQKSSSIDFNDIYSSSGKHVNRSTENASRFSSPSLVRRTGPNSTLNGNTRRKNTAAVRKKSDRPADMGLLRQMRQRRELAMKYGGFYALLAMCFSFFLTLPAAFVLLLLTLRAEYRGFAFQLLHIYQRPMPLDASTIESGDKILKLIIHIVILTNSTLIIFQSRFFSTWPLVYQLCLLIGCLLFCYVCQYALGRGRCRRNVLKEVLIQRKRCEFFTEKFWDQVPDSINNARLEML